MTDIQGALKELILPASAKPPAWARHQTNNRPGSQIRLKRIRPRHKMIVSMHMAGFTDVEIAHALGYTPSRVGMILRSTHPELAKVKKELADVVSRQMGDLVLRFRAESSKSLETLVDIRDDTEAPRSERRLSALAILDRAGYAPVRKQINLDTQVPFDEMRQVFGQIESANEVAIRRSEWEITDVPKESK